MSTPSKLEFDELCDGMQVFLDFPDVERDIFLEIQKSVQKILLSPVQNGKRPPEQVMADYLNAGEDAEERLKVILGFSNGSLEKIKRIYKAIFPNTSWNALKHDNDVRQRIADFLVDPEREEAIVPAFIRGSFFLPHDWKNLLQDKTHMTRLVQGNFQSLYSVRIGIALEERVRRHISNWGYNSEKGPVDIAGGKEVDIAIPNTAQPQIIIMSSYQLTTSSVQSMKPNEQDRMYQLIRNHNRQNLDDPNVIFINVIDGGGWLARKKDLKRMWHSSDFCFPSSSLEDLKKVVENYLA